MPDEPSETPNIDALAKGGMRFTDFHAMPLCTPSRAQLLTGRLAPRQGVYTNFSPDSLGGLNTSEITLAEFLKAQGYATAIRGKWHLGHNPPHHPSYRGFDESTIVPYSVDMGCVDNSTWFVPPTGANRPIMADCLSGKPGVTLPALPLYNATTNCSGTGDCNAAIVSQPLDLSDLSDTYNAEAHRCVEQAGFTGPAEPCSLVPADLFVHRLLSSIALHPALLQVHPELRGRRAALLPILPLQPHARASDDSQPLGERVHC